MAISFGLPLFLHPLFVFVIFFFSSGRLYGGSGATATLPPGPPAWPIVGNLLQLRLSGNGFESSVKKLHERYGPIITMWFGSRPMIMIAGRELAHEALIQKGSVFADRPPHGETRKLFTNNLHNIALAVYGPLWRTLRRNLVSEALGPSAMKAFRDVREWGIDRLVDEGLGVPAFFFRRRRARMAEVRLKQREVLLPLINKRRYAPRTTGGAYVDTLLNLTVDGGRSLNDDELVTLCMEFIIGGTDTTSTSVQWLIANLVIHEGIQARLYDEIVGAAGSGKLVEESLQRMPYLEALAMETLRRHPPGHFVLPHAVTKPCQLAKLGL